MSVNPASIKDDGADQESATCVISGGGPAGVMLGLLLARAGLNVTVLEKHRDFLRDFRGDTVHPSTQALLAELGLSRELEAVVHGRISRVRMGTATEALIDADVRLANRRAPFHDIALVAQWDLLDLLVRAGAKYPGFDLRLGAETLGPIRRGGAVSGVRYRDEFGEHEIRAVLTVAADGRGSRLRNAAGSMMRELGAPMDVLWFRLPRKSEDGAGLQGLIGSGELAVMIDRDDYWQVAFLIPKGTYDDVLTAGMPAFKLRIASLMPLLSDRVDTLRDWDDIKMLRVGLNRLSRWSSAGFLAIGDAAHTMSPIGGVGINLAIQDAVATANLLAEPLLRAQADPNRFSRTLNPRLVERVERRRRFPTVVTQAIQQVAQRRVIDTVLGAGKTLKVPRIARLVLTKDGPLNRLFVRILMYGVLPEHIRTPEVVSSGRPPGRHRSADRRTG